MMTTFPRLLLAATFLASADAFGYIIPPETTTTAAPPVETTTTAAPAGAQAKVSTSLFMTGLSASDVNEDADVRAAFKATIISLGGYDEVSNIVAKTTSVRRRLQLEDGAEVSFDGYFSAEDVSAAEDAAEEAETGRRRDGRLSTCWALPSPSRSTSWLRKSSFSMV